MDTNKEIKFNNSLKFLRKRREEISKEMAENPKAFRKKMEKHWQNYQKQKNA